MAKQQVDEKHSNDYLETDKSHKKWYDSELGMGKQRGKPKAMQQRSKKQKGNFQKHQHK